MQQELCLMAEYNKWLLPEHTHQARAGLITALAASQVLQSSPGRDGFLSVQASDSRCVTDQKGLAVSVSAGILYTLKGFALQSKSLLLWQTVKPSTFYCFLTAVQLSVLQYLSSKMVTLCLIWIALGSIVHSTSYLEDGFLRWKATTSSPGEPVG